MIQIDKYSLKNGVFFSTCGATGPWGACTGERALLLAGNYGDKASKLKVRGGGHWRRSARSQGNEKVKSGGYKQSRVNSRFGDIKFRKFKIKRDGKAMRQTGNVII